MLHTQETKPEVHRGAGVGSGKNTSLSKPRAAMRFFFSCRTTVLIAAAAVACSSLLASQASAGVVKVNLVGKRGTTEDIVSILKSKKAAGQSFCSTFLHLPPYAATKTITITRASAKTVPASTIIKGTTLTRTASAITKLSTNVVVVAVTPTTSVTSQSIVPITSTVATVTSIVATTTSVVSTVTSTSFIPQLRDERPTHDPSRTRLPYWLNQYSCPQVSKACRRIVTSKTLTTAKTVTVPTTIKAGAATIGKTSTVLLTRTVIAVTAVSSTSIVQAVTSTVITTSTSIVPVTATVESTLVLPVTATATVALPALRGRIYARSVDGSGVGYLAKQPSSNLLVRLTTDVTQAQTVNLPGLVVGSKFEIGTPGAPYPFLGAIEATDPRIGQDLKDGSYSWVWPTYMTSEDDRSDQFADSVYTTNLDPEPSLQSDIWRLNGLNQLSAEWTNSDGEVRQTFPIYTYRAPGFRYLSAIPQRSPHLSLKGKRSSVVTLYFEPF
ncbi:hypothetical protein V8E36_009826 [Tilletia maclaganii]